MSGAVTDCARRTLEIIASNPGAMVSHVHLAAGIDALVALYVESRPEGMNARQASLRSPAAVLRSVHAHVENQIHALKRQSGRA